MKLLVVLSRVPYPLEKGDKLRAFHQIRCLSETNEIYLFCLSHKKTDPKAYEFLNPYCKKIEIVPIKKREYVTNILKSFFQSKPFQIGYFFSKNAKKRYIHFEQEVQPNHIYCQFVRTAELVKDSEIPKTIDYQDALSKNTERRISKAPFYLKPVLKYEAKALARYETEVFNIFDTHTIISEADRCFIQTPLRENIHVIPNGVDFEFYHPMPEKEKKFDIVFTGNMQYPPNVDAAIFLITKIMPLLWGKNPSLKVLIAGANPDYRLKKLASDNVCISGWVDDIRKCYASAKVFTAPMRIGTGLQNKLLEAMAMQLPCVTSPLVNQALQATDKEEILIAETAKEYADAIKLLLKNQSISAKIALSGYTYVKSHFDWESFCTKLDRVLQM
ncbi:glycosyltransferase [Bacteroidales bacterium OttesenSCG-928-C19]|nr:glycosyltransferase [Bacteroidales bacterium OttesenSCG-928-C19]